MQSDAELCGLTSGTSNSGERPRSAFMLKEIWDRRVPELSAGVSGELAGDLFVQDFPHRQGDDDGVVVFEDAVDFAEGVFRVVKGDEKAFFPPAAVPLGCRESAADGH